MVLNKLWSLSGLVNYYAISLELGLLSLFLQYIHFFFKAIQWNLDITKPRYIYQILLVVWPFVIWRFHCITLKEKKYCENRLGKFGFIECTQYELN